MQSLPMQKRDCTQQWSVRFLEESERMLQDILHLLGTEACFGAFYFQGQRKVCGGVVISLYAQNFGCNLKTNFLKTRFSYPY